MTQKLNLSVVTVVDVAASACLKGGSQVTAAAASIPYLALPWFCTRFGIFVCVLSSTY